MLKSKLLNLLENILLAARKKQDEQSKTKWLPNTYSPYRNAKGATLRPRHSEAV